MRRRRCGGRLDRLAGRFWESDDQLLPSLDRRGTRLGGCRDARLSAGRFGGALGACALRGLGTRGRHRPGSGCLCTRRGCGWLRPMARSVRLGSRRRTVRAVGCLWLGASGAPLERHRRVDGRRRGHAHRCAQAEAPRLSEGEPRWARGVHGIGRSSTWLGDRSRRDRLARSCAYRARRGGLLREIGLRVDLAEQAGRQRLGPRHLDGWRPRRSRITGWWQRLRVDRTCRRRRHRDGIVPGVLEDGPRTARRLRGHRSRRGPPDHQIRATRIALGRGGRGEDHPRRCRRTAQVPERSESQRWLRAAMEALEEGPARRDQGRRADRTLDGRQRGPLARSLPRHRLSRLLPMNR